MDDSVYEVEAALERTHWWFVGRRLLFHNVLQKLNCPGSASVLDVGTGTGANLIVPQGLKFQNITGIDFNQAAVNFCHQKGFSNVRQGDICQLPFADGSFELVLATDVIEHIDDDGKALRELWRVLMPGGWALITVPAFESLWGVQDEIGHHKRRYRRRELCRLIDDAGLQVRRSFYFNYVLFLPIWMARRILKWFRIQPKNENELNSPLLNRLLKFVFGIDVLTAPWVRPPFGVSILALSTKTYSSSPRAGDK